MLNDDLTESERRLRDAVTTGDYVDLRDPKRPALGDVATGAAWGPEQSLRAHVLIDLLTTEWGPNERQPRALRLAGARVRGMLNLEDLVLVRPLVLEGCFFDSPVLLDAARAPRVELQGCHVPFLTARQLDTRGDLRLDRLTGADYVVLTGARIGGVLVLREARLGNKHGIVLSGDQLDVHGDVDCSRLQANGELLLASAHIGGQLKFHGAQLRNENAAALTADGLQVDGSVFCNPFDGQRFEATGELRLLGAHIGGQLSFSGAQLRNENAAALTADWLHVDGSMFCNKVDGQTVDGQPFKATGELRLLGAHIGGQLSFVGAQLRNEDATALNADGLQVDGSMFCDAVDGRPFEATGELCLAGAHIGGHLSFSGAQLRNEDATALNAEGLHVDGSMFCNAFDVHPFDATGELRLMGAHIGGELNFYGARLHNEEDPALNADWLQVGGSMLCNAIDGQPFEATGELRLPGGHIGGELSFQGAQLRSDNDAPALNAEALQVDENMFCRAVDGQPFKATGELRLMRARIGGRLTKGTDRNKLTISGRNWECRAVTGQRAQC